jgi:nucleoside-diphosphate-sugar epimerase
MRNERMTVLVTGAAGVLGQALLHALDDSVEPIALVHSTPVPDPRVPSVRGDVSRPRLGLSREQHDELAHRVDCVVHSAAVSNFSESPARIVAANVDGTEHALEFAARAGATFLHVGTALERAPGASDDLLERSPVARSTDVYRRSKLLADELVERSAVPHVTVKPSLVLGDSRTGWIAKFQGIHMLIGYLMRGDIPALPFDPATPVDWIPQDVVAEVIADLIHRPFDGAVHYATLGSDATTLGDLVDWGAEFADEVGIPREDGLRFVDPDIVDRLLRPVFMDRFSRRARRRIERALEWESYVNQRQVLRSSLPELRERFGVGHLPDLEEAYKAGLHYWANHSGVVERVKRRHAGSAA